MKASARCLDLISVVTISLTAWETGNGVNLRLAAKIREAEMCDGRSSLFNLCIGFISVSAMCLVLVNKANGHCTFIFE